MDLFHFVKAYAESEVRELKIKRNGGKRLVIYYMSIGGRITGIIGMAPGKQASPAASREKPALEGKLRRQILGCGLAKNNYGKRRIVSKKDS